MTSAVRFWAIVPAAGTGTRFSTGIAKQFYPLRGKPLAQRTLERLLAVSALEKIIVPCAMQASAWREVQAVHHPRVMLVAGGAERVDSVNNGLIALAEMARNDDWVLVHDMARPCVTVADIEKLMSQLDGQSTGGILASRISDTLKRVTPGGEIISTADRNSFRAALTPQMFRFGMLRRALDASLSSRNAPTDEAAAVEALGERVLVIEGRGDNIKVTRREDLAIAAAILDYQEEEQCE